MKAFFSPINLLRIFFGFIFILSGCIKFTDINSFAEALGKFKLVSDDLFNFTTYAIPIVEILLGIGLVINFKSIYMGQITIGMVSLFTAVIISKIFEGEEINCGCFGKLTSGNIDYFTVLRNIVLILIGVFITSYYKSEQYENIKFNFYLKYGLNTLGLTLVFFLIVQTYVFALQNRELKNRLNMFLNEQKILKSGDAVKPFSAIDLLGNEINIVYNTGTYNYYILAIMSVECEPCKENINNWNILLARLNGKNVRFISVAMDSISIINKLAKSEYYNFPILSNPSYEFKIGYKGFITPQTILINKNGIVLKAIPGILNENKIIQLLELIKVNNKKL